MLRPLGLLSPPAIFSRKSCDRRVRIDDPQKWIEVRQLGWRAHSDPRSYRYLKRIYERNLRPISNILTPTGHERHLNVDDRVLSIILQNKDKINGATYVVTSVIVIYQPQPESSYNLLISMNLSRYVIPTFGTL